MRTKLLGQFLLEEGLISPEQLRHTLAVQGQSTPKIGELGVALGYMSMTDVDLVHLQQRHRSDPFGEIAVATGFLSQEQVDELLDYQASSRRLTGQILVSFGYITEKQLDWALSELATESPLDLQDAVSAVRDQHERRFARITLDVVRHAFENVTGSPLRVRPGSEDTTGMQRLAWEQSISNGPERYTLRWHADERSTVVLASKMLGFEVDAIDELTIDAVGEFLNLAVGHVCSKLKPYEGGTKASPPRFVTDEIEEGLDAYFALEGGVAQFTGGVKAELVA